MNLTAKVKLQPSTEQAASLDATLRRANEACNWMSERAWEAKTFGKYSLHKVVYYDARERFGLAAQVTVRAVAKVADAYRLNKRVCHTFRALGAFPYDSRILSWKLDESTVSIWTLDGRRTIPFVCRGRDRELLAGKRGEADLCVIDGGWYLFVTCEVETPDPTDVDEYLGVDLGIVNVATDSDGTVYSGAQMTGLRHRHRRLRARLQAKGTKSAKRLLRKRSRKEARYAKNENHRISKRIVATAECTGRGIALEDLVGILRRVKARKPQRATLHSWSFAQLAAFIGYKAALVGVPAVHVDPRNTSRTCPECGCIDKANRRTQSSFSCVSCGFSGLADHIAAIVIGRRAVVNRPHAAATFSR